MGLYSLTLEITPIQKPTKQVASFIASPDYEKLNPGELGINVMNAVNILPFGENIDSKLKRYVTQWKGKYDFHLVDIFYNLRNQDRKKARGIKQLDFTYRITDSKGDTSRIKIMDIIPKTKWVNKNYSVKISGEASAEAKIGFSAKPLDSASVDISTKASATASFKYEWNPKIGKIKSNASSFILNNTNNEFLDGRISMTLLIQRNRNVKEMFFKGQGKILFDIGWGTDVNGYSPKIIEEIMFVDSKKIV